jgi:hypothetical protein
MGGLSNHCFSHIKSKLSPSKDCAPEHAWGAVDAQSSFHDLKKGSKYQKINPRPRILICTFDWSVPWLLRSKIWGNKTILLSSWRIKSHLEYASEHLPRFEGTMYGWNPVKKKKKTSFPLDVPSTEWGTITKFVHMIPTLTGDASHPSIYFGPELQNVHPKWMFCTSIAQVNPPFFRW